MEEARRAAEEAVKEEQRRAAHDAAQRAAALRVAEARDRCALHSSCGSGCALARVPLAPRILSLASCLTLSECAPPLPLPLPLPQVLHKQAEKEAELAALQQVRSAEAARRALERRLDLQSKAEAVEEMKRRDEYERALALQRIQAETERASALLDQRAQLQDQRRVANTEASFQRQKIISAMEKLQVSSRGSVASSGRAGVRR